MKSESERFFEKVQRDPVTGCWNWTGATGKGGYGSFWDKQAGRVTVASRWVYETYIGPLFTDFACHRCDNPACVNPGHLFAGSARMNNTDCFLKGRYITPPGLKGELHPAAKLSEQEVIQIRADYFPRVMSCRRLAQKYDVSPAAIHRVVSGKLWSCS